MSKFNKTKEDYAEVRRKQTQIYKIDLQELKEVASKSNHLRDIFNYFGLRYGGSSSNLMKRRLFEENIDVSHIPETDWTKREYKKVENDQRKNPKKRRPLEEIMTENSDYNSTDLKKRLLNDGILENCCAVCGLGPEWNGEELILEIDHINGIHRDNRLENLRIICPNCHSQGPTHAGRNLAHNKQEGRIYNKDRSFEIDDEPCPVCDGEKPKGYDTCSRSCLAKTMESLQISDEELWELKKTMTGNAIAKKYDVGATGIWKRLKRIKMKLEKEKLDEPLK